VATRKIPRSEHCGSRLHVKTRVSSRTEPRNNRRGICTPCIRIMPIMSTIHTADPNFFTAQPHPQLHHLKSPSYPLTHISSPSPKPASTSSNFSPASPQSTHLLATPKPLTASSRQVSASPQLRTRISEERKTESPAVQTTRTDVSAAQDQVRTDVSAVLVRGPWDRRQKQTRVREVA